MKKSYIFILLFAVVVVGGVWFMMNLDADEAGIREESSPVTSSDNLFIQAQSEDSFQDKLSTRNDQDSPVEIAVIGSSVAEGQGASEYNQAWPSLLESSLNESDQNVRVTNFAVSGFKVSDLIDKGDVDELIQSSPDVILFETSVINSYYHDEPIDETKDSIKLAAQKIEEELPNAYLVFMAPNPISESMYSVATSELDFEDYVYETEQFIIESGWDYFDTYTAWNRQMEEEGMDLDSLLDDGTHPNDEGYQMWFDLLNESMIQA
ncbi:SGNH/GDSL hydrolase family protein [Alkalihalobacillus sp. FSL R5-0424]